MRFINFIRSKSTSPDITLLKWWFFYCRPFYCRKRTSIRYWGIINFLFFKRIFWSYRMISFFRKFLKFVQCFVYHFYRLFLINFFIISFLFNFDQERWSPITSPNKFNIIITLRIFKRRRSNCYKPSFWKFIQLFFKNLIN